MALPPPSDPSHPDFAAWAHEHAGFPAPTAVEHEPEPEVEPVKRAAPVKAAAKKAHPKAKK